jgi:hypothetical protein
MVVAALGLFYFVLALPVDDARPSDNGFIERFGVSTIFANVFDCFFNCDVHKMVVAGDLADHLAVAVESEQQAFVVVTTEICGVTLFG